MASIRTKLISLSVSIVIITMTGLSTINIYSTKQNTENNIKEQINFLMQTYVNEIDNWIQTKRKAANGMTVLLGETNLEKITYTAKLLAKATGDYFYMGLPDKAFMAEKTLGSGSTYLSDYDPTSRVWYKQAVQEGKAIVTAPYIGKTQQALVVTIAEPIKDNAGKIISVVGADVTLPDIIKLVGKLKPTPNSFAFLVNGSGTIITHSEDEKLTLKNLSEYTDAITVSDLGTLAATEDKKDVTIDSVEGYVFSKSIPMTDWYLVSFVNKAEANNNIYELIHTSGILSLVFILLSVILITGSIVNVTRRLVRIRDAMESVATGDGDLTKRLEMNGKDELSHIAAAFNGFVNKISGILKEIKNTSESVKISASEIAAGNMDLSVRTEQQASSLEKTNLAMENLTVMVQQNANHATEANTLVVKASDIAEKGGATMEKVVTSMESIKTSSEKIVEIISVIDGISFQTNILALNAAVEAARAGEQGRGFAVVASEVRALAQKSSQAAQEIKVLIDHSVQEIQGGSQHVTNAGHTMTEVVSSIKSVTTIVSEINNASDNQSKGIVDIGSTIVKMDEMTQQNSALVEESAAAATSLKEQAEKLAEMVNVFKLDNDRNNKQQ